MSESGKWKAMPFEPDIFKPCFSETTADATAVFNCVAACRTSGSSVMLANTSEKFSRSMNDGAASSPNREK